MFRVRRSNNQARLVRFRESIKSLRMQVRWWVAHPYRTAILSDPERCAPIRVWGDESAINKERDRNVLIGSFASLTSTLQTRLRELLSFCIQKEIIIWDATDFCAYEVWTWSFNQLALGCGPQLITTTRFL